MAVQDYWLRTNSGSLAAALEAQREAICSSLTARLLRTFPRLCYDPERADGWTFQQMTMRRTPERLHTLIQTALRLRNLSIIEREYEWSWPIVQRYGGHRQHMIAHVNWYFETARAHIRFEDGDRAALNALEIAVVQIVERATMIEDGVIQKPAKAEQRNGHASKTS